MKNREARIMRAAVWFIPFAACWLLTYIIDYSTIIMLYVFTVAYIIAYYRRKWNSPFVLPVSFAATPLAVYLYETARPGWFQYLGTAMAALFYALPIVVTTLIIAIVKAVRGKI